MQKLLSLDVVEFAAACMETRKAEDLLKTAEREFKKCGFTGVVYSYIPHIGAYDYKLKRTFYTDVNLDDQYKEGWLKSYFDTYINRHDPIQNHCFKTAQAIWSKDLLKDANFQTKEYQAYLNSIIKTFGHFMVVPAFGPRRSRGIIGLVTEKSAPPPCAQATQILEYCCFLIHRQYVKIKASKHREISLTPREKDVLRLIPLGKSNREIGMILDITANTVNGHIKQIFTKLDAPDRLTASLRGFTLDLID